VPRNVDKGESKNLTMNPHEKLDKLSLEYHKLISEKLKRDPELLETVIQTLRSVVEEWVPAGILSG
jgi:hypothetical protein